MGYNDNGAENGSNIFTKQKYVPRNWNGVGGGGVYDCGGGVGSGGNEMGLYLSWTKRAFLFLQISSDQ